VLGDVHASEAIDVGAILGLAPWLVFPCPGVAAVAEFIVDINASTRRHHTLKGDDGLLTIDEAPATQADVRVRGTQRDRVAALGPRADVSGLRIDGDELLAALLLAEVAGAGAVGDEPSSRLG
jgi:hypothetical protein